MSFNKNCMFLDESKGERNLAEKGLVGGGKAHAVGRIWHPCLSDKNPDNWIFECPEICPYFKPK